MKKPIENNKVVVFTGAGVSAESGLSTYRDSDGLWNNYPVDLVASARGWEAEPKLLCGFYNELRKNVGVAEPNAAHLAIADLEKHFNVVVVTQNIDDLHERAGSTNVLHLHGEIVKVRSSVNREAVIDVGYSEVNFGDTCNAGGQLRPHVVFFGEMPFLLDEAKAHIQTAAYVLVVGTSLVVEPAASLLKKARFHAKKIMVSKEVDKIPYGFEVARGSAGELVPRVCNRWVNGLTE